MIEVLTLLDIAKLNGRDQEVGLIEENLVYAPEIGIVPSRVIRGSSYKAVKRVSLPGGGGFRSPNQGVSAGKSVFEPVLTECYLYTKLLKADPQTLEVGEDDSMEDLKALETSGSVQHAFQFLAKQFYSGAANDAKGFPGIASFSNPDLELSAGGTTEDTASSVWGVKFGVRNVHFVFGKNSTLAFSEWIKTTFTDDNSKEYIGEISQLDSWMGLANGDKYSVGRVKTLTADANKGLTDALLTKLLAKYPVGYRPDYWFMSRRSLLQLQLSRSVPLNVSGPKSSTGNEVIAPIPTESNGVPIVVTDSISDTDKLAA